MVVLSFSEAMDVAHRIIIIERQHAENWISQVIVRALFYGFVGEI